MIISMHADQRTREPTHHEGYRLGWDFHHSEFVVYLNSEEVARLKADTSAKLLHEIRQRNSETVRAY